MNQIITVFTSNKRQRLLFSQRRKVFGFFALGVLLGLLIGALLAAILVLVLLKCCDKGKVAPYYTVSPGTTGYLHNDNQSHCGWFCTSGRYMFLRYATHSISVI